MALPDLLHPRRRRDELPSRSTNNPFSEMKKMIESDNPDNKKQPAQDVLANEFLWTRQAFSRKACVHSGSFAFTQWTPPVDGPPGPPRDL